MRSLGCAIGYPLVSQVPGRSVLVHRAPPHGKGNGKVTRTMGRLLRTCLVAFCATAVLDPGLASAAVDWGPQRTVADWSWSSGRPSCERATVARRSSISSSSTDNVDGSFATDHGPYQGVFLTSSDDRGRRWSSTATRQSGGHDTPTGGALAASGSTLYAAWVDQRATTTTTPPARRVLYFRADPGATPGGWGPTIRLSKQKGRVDAPAIAAYGPACLRRVDRREHRRSPRRVDRRPREDVEP